MALKWMGLVIAAFGIAFPAFADGQERVHAEGPVPLMPVECHGHQSFNGECCVQGARANIVRRQAVTRSVMHDPARIHRDVHTDSAITQGFDFSGFNGGVGAIISGGIVSGGGNVIIIREEGQRFSGVRSTAVGRSVLSRKLDGSGY